MKKVTGNLKKRHENERSSKKKNRDRNAASMRAFFASMEHVNAMNTLVMNNLRYMRMLEISRNIAAANLYAQNVYAGNLYTKNLHVYPEEQNAKVTPKPDPERPADGDRFIRLMRGGAERSGTERGGTERSGAERSGAERSGPPSTVSEVTTFGAEVAACANLLAGFSMGSKSVSTAPEFPD